MSEPQKILVARYRFIGDTLLTIPFLRALRQEHPTAEIHLLMGADAFALVEHCPYIDKAISFEPRQLGYWGAIQRIRREKYDRVYLLKRSFSSALIMALAGIHERIGFDTDNRGFLLTRRVPYLSHEKHEALCFLDLLSNQVGKTPDLTLESWITPETEASVLHLLDMQPGQRIVLHATSTNTAKCWPVSHFQVLAAQLVENTQAQLYFMGTPGEAAFYENLSAGLPQEIQSRTHNLCGKTTILQSMALLKHMTLVVANDSGMIHMAAAAGIPVVAIFGPMDPRQWHPLSDNHTLVTHPDLTCRPCRMKITCGHLYPCLTELSPQVVLEACKPYLIS